MAVSKILFDDEVYSEVYKDTSSGVVLTKVGDIVNAIIPRLDSRSMAAWSQFIICNIPERFRPSTSNIWFPVCRQSTTALIPLFYEVTTYGDIYLDLEGNAATTGVLMATSITWSIASDA